MVIHITKRARCFTYEKEKIVIIFCPRISECPRHCSTHRKYAKLGYDIICLNPCFFRVEDRDRILEDVLKERDAIKNRLGLKD